MKPLVRNAFLLLVLFLISWAAFAQTTPRHDGTVAWQQFRWPEFRFGRCLPANNHVVCLGNDGSVGVFRLSVAEDEPLAVDMHRVGEGTVQGLIREYRDLSIVDAHVTGNVVWALYRDNQREVDGAVRWDRTFVRIDVSEPSRPTIRTYETPDDLYATSFAVHGDYIYTDSFGLGISVLRVAPQAEITLVGRTDVGAAIFHVAIHNNRLYAVVRNGGVAAFDLSDPEQPQVTAEAPTGRTWNIVFDGMTGYAITNTGIMVLDVSQRGNLSILGEAQWDYIGDAPGWAVLPLEGRLAVFRRTPHARDRIEVYDVADPQNPNLDTTLPMYGAERPMAIAGSSVVITPVGIAYDFSAQPQSSNNPTISGTITVPGTHNWNPDSGALNVDHAGLRWSVENDTRRALTPRINLRIALMDGYSFDEVTETMIRESDLSEDPIELSIHDQRLTPGMVVGFQLDDGRVGKLTVTRLYDSRATDYPGYELTRPAWRDLLDSRPALPAYHLGIRYEIFP